ncbi:hypothetical protein NKH77_11795 [Streptomyces sp. M19]
MALELADSSPVFAESFRRCVTAVERYTDFSVEAVLRVMRVPLPWSGWMSSSRCCGW